MGRQNPPKDILVDFLQHLLQDERAVARCSVTDDVELPDVEKEEDELQYISQNMTETKDHSSF